MNQILEYVSVNDGQDVWKIDHECGFAVWIDSPLAKEVEKQVKALTLDGFSCSVTDYLESLGYKVKEHSNWTMEFSK